MRFLRLNFIPRSADFGLLVLRVMIGVGLFTFGWQKLMNFGAISSQFPNFLGLGSKVNLGLVVFAEVVGSALVVLGLLARFGAFLCAFTMGVAFFVAHGMRLQGDGNGMPAFLFLAGFAAVFFAGPGRFSIDQKLGGA
jgi:putative oxidoreductase